MSPVNPASSAIGLMLLTIISIQNAVANPSGPLNNDTDQSSTWQSGRVKRQMPNGAPDSFLLKVKYETDVEVNLIFRKAAANLANANLPVITPFGDFNPNLMKNLGDFTTYHEVNRCAAVVYFKKLNALFGVIGTNYYIDGLPFALVYDGKSLLEAVGAPYVKKHEYAYSHIVPISYIAPPSDTEIWDNIIRPTGSDENQRRKRPVYCEGPNAKRQRIEENSNVSGDEEDTNVDADANRKVHQVDVGKERQDELLTQDYYIEIAVYVARDFVELFKELRGVGDRNMRIVRCMITYFNAVDMMFQKAQMFKKKLFINIAKIIIEDNLVPFEFMNNGKLQWSNVVAKVPQHFRDERFYNRPDSFDHVFIYTSRPIFDGPIMVNGFSKHAGDLYEARKTRRFYEAVPISIVRYQSNYVDYTTAVHEISRAFNIKLDPQSKGLTWTGQCYGIMQQDGAKCKNCFKWSTESIDHLSALLSNDRNRCFLMNKPRSLYPLGVMPLYAPDKQCECFGYYSYIPTDVENPGFISPNECNAPMQCGVTEGTLVSHFTVRPFDGTPCGPHMACWDKRCVRNMPTNYLPKEEWSANFM